MKRIPSTRTEPEPDRARRLEIAILVAGLEAIAGTKQHKTICWRVFDLAGFGAAQELLIGWGCTIDLRPEEVTA